MKNGKSVVLTEKQKSKLMLEYNSCRVKQDIANKYDLSILTIERTIANGRCSERVFNVLFKNKKW